MSLPPARTATTSADVGGWDQRRLRQLYLQRQCVAATPRGGRCVRAGTGRLQRCPAHDGAPAAEPSALFDALTVALGGGADVEAALYETLFPLPAGAQVTCTTDRETVIWYDDGPPEGEVLAHLAECAGTGVLESTPGAGPAGVDGGPCVPTTDMGVFRCRRQRSAWACALAVVRWRRAGRPLPEVVERAGHCYVDPRHAGSRELAALADGLADPAGEASVEERLAVTVLNAAVQVRLAGRERLIADLACYAETAAAVWPAVEAALAPAARG